MQIYSYIPSSHCPRQPCMASCFYNLTIKEENYKFYKMIVLFYYFQRLGVTLKNPNCPHTNVVRAATDLFVDDCKDFWILSGSRIHNGTFEKEYDFNIHSLKLNDCLGVQVTHDGQLVFYANGVNKGVAFSGLPVKKDIFAIFDVYGRTKEVTWKYYGGKQARI